MTKATYLPIPVSTRMLCALQGIELWENEEGWWAPQEFGLGWPGGSERLEACGLEWDSFTLTQHPCAQDALEWWIKVRPILSSFSPNPL